MICLILALCLLVLVVLLVVSFELTRHDMPGLLKCRQTNPKREMEINLETGKGRATSKHNELSKTYKYEEFKTKKDHNMKLPI